MPDGADLINPYQSPAEANPAATTLTADQRRHVELLRDFRSQSATLGVCWIVFGVIALAAGVFVAVETLSSGWRELPKTTVRFLVTLVVLGLVWIALGALVYRKGIWALYAALLLTYLALLGNIVQLSILRVVLIATVIVQAHRVLLWARQLRRAGIPLTARPLDLVPHTVPTER